MSKIHNLDIKAMINPADETNATLEIFESIGASHESGVTTKKVASFLADNPNIKTLDVRIASTGGEAWEGVAIMNLLKTCKATVNVEIMSIAASSASVIAMGGDRVKIHPNAQIMIHNAWIMAIGNAIELRKLADDLEVTDNAIAKAYTTKTGMTYEAVKALMDAETYLDADKAFELGFADEIVGVKTREETKEDLKADIPSVMDEITPAEDISAETPSAEPEASASEEKTEEPKPVEDEKSAGFFGFK